MATIIVTVGTSLHTASQRDGTDETLLAYLNRNYPKASAETNSLDCLHLTGGEHLYFISSGDETCYACAEVLAEYYANRGHLVFVRQVKRLTKDYAQFRDVGLTDFINELADIIDADPDACAICATGGFKAEIAYAVTVGLLYGVPVYYLHEDFKNIIEMPKLPITFNFDFFGRYLAELEAVTKAPNRQEARKILENIPPELHLLVQRQDPPAAYDWSPLGQAIHRAYLYHNRSRPKEIPMRIGKNHSYLWGAGTPKMEDIRDRDAQTILRRLARLGPRIKAIYWDEMQAGAGDETHLRFVEKSAGVLRYKLITPSGSQFLKIETDPGLEDELLFLLGKKVYA